MQVKNAAKRITKNASALQIGIVVSNYYADTITGKLLLGAEAVLKEWKVLPKNITVVRVPGCFEIPYGCITLLKQKKYDALITLGCIVKGETEHDRYIASAVSQGIMDLTLAHGVPIAFGVLTVNNLAQAKARSTGKNNKGVEAAIAALEATFLKK
ncbi:MAG: 6,7-dimethyl-8-ribityllumazine synthase [Candidatus Moranbacteria bacterium]|nr:6,7-dimethyl-8-ribityllumazine synthase [Candidatus Moranbacteria bacterium]